MHAQALAHTALPSGRLAHLPVSFFSVIMGMGGLTLAWLKAHQVFGLPAGVGEWLRILSSVLYVVLAGLYLAKFLRYPQAVRAEFDHPVRQSFFPAMSIGLVLLATAWATPAPRIAAGLWSIGAGLQLAFTLRTLNAWLHGSQYQITHVSPAWFIPVVGNILLPIGGVHFAPADLSWFFFSIGLLFWLVLLSVVFYRMVFHEALPPRLMPTLFILVAPPALGFVSYVALSGHIDAFARILYFTALFQALLLASDAMRFLRLPFFLSAWAYTFPLAALTVATLIMFAHGGAIFYGVLAALLLGILSSIVLLLLVRTALAAAQGKICVPE